MPAARFFVTALMTFVAVLALVDVIVREWLPIFPRVAESFSAAYLERVIARGIDDRVVLLGDSVLWGYKIPVIASAAARLRDDGVPVTNLSYEGGSIVNTYALLRLMQAATRRPRIVAFNVNIKEFNPLDSAYNTLHPGVERLVWPLLSDDERRALHRTSPAGDGTGDLVSRVWETYAVRADLRYALFGNADAATSLSDIVGRLSGRNERVAAAHRPTPDRFLGTYDLSPLADSNVEYVFLKKTAGLLRDWHVPAYAILTPTNHTLLHDYVDNDEYAAQLRAVRSAFAHSGVHVLDYDRVFAANEFLDNDHLTIEGNARLAELLLAPLSK